MYQNTGYGADVATHLATLETNKNNLNDIKGKQKVQDEKFQAIELKLQQLDQGLKGHGAILTALSNTQAQQGQLLKNLNGKVDKLVQTITPQNVVTQSQSGHTQQIATSTPNTSQGGPEGRVP